MTLPGRVVLRPGGYALVSGLWAAVVVVIIVTNGALGAVPTAFLVIVLAGIGQQVINSLTSRAVAVDGGVRVRNGLRIRRPDQRDLSELRVTRLATNWNSRRDVHEGGFQRVRLDVLLTDGSTFAIVASERWIIQPRLPEIYDRFADAAGMPITFLGHPGGLWGVRS